MEFSIRPSLVCQRGGVSLVRGNGSLPFSERLRAASKAYGDGPGGVLDALIDGCDGGPD